MKKQKSLTAKNILFALILAVLIAIPTASARAQASEPPTNENQVAARQADCDWLCQLKERQAQALEGSWVITVTLAVPPGVPQPPSFPAYSSYARGGAVIASDRAHPFSNPRHGAWVHTGGSGFAATEIQDEFDAQGNFQGTLTVRDRITVTGANTLVGVANAESRDAAGNLVFNVCATIRGERIRVEPLSPQCQSITPPQ